MVMVLEVTVVVIIPVTVKEIVAVGVGEIPALVNQALIVIINANPVETGKSKKYIGIMHLVGIVHSKIGLLLTNTLTKIYVLLVQKEMMSVVPKKQKQAEGQLYVQ